MNKTVKWILVIIGIVIVLLIAGKFVFGDNEGGGIKVATEKAAKRTIIETVTASGKIYPETEVKITPDISGEITELNVHEGDTVKKGQILARIYADIYALQKDMAASRVNQSEATVANSEESLNALKASLDQAKQAYDRNKSLFDQKVISKSEMEQYETAYRTALANFNAAKQNIVSLKAGVQSAQTDLTSAAKNLSRTTLTSPMDGVITSLKVKKGERVAGNSFTLGTEMMTVSDLSVIEVRVDVGENDIVKVNIGDSADVEVDAYNNRKFAGIVTKISSSANATAVGASNDVTNYEVRIRLIRDSYKDLITKTFPFRPGMNASADIKTRQHDNVLSVPITAVNARVKGSDKNLADKKKEESKMKENDNNLQDDNNSTDSDELEEVVFVLQKDGKVKKTVVTTGIQDLNYIEITSGLNPGDEVVSGPYAAISKTLKDGSKVKVVPKDKLFQN
ncbi:MAG: efflux RND transporter periplasmic adaptor subunit [Chitinophagaceae bacterium]|jgi:HlyD family secretion protein|nr:efflux RND transporter periplasmic adaptor subunit [Chitinophagaceae bacterium]OQY95731.1 MAG: efflux transporter periplasmic adaptor subunit [Sphingobacteriales bacterium UTBCD1]